jgi:diguanylate cyclase (GGDEF)-like protein
LAEHSASIWEAAVNLKLKLIAATSASAAAILGLALYVFFGASTLDERLSATERATTALRNHTNADMMHDAVRADVYAALNAAASGRGDRALALAAVKTHTAELQHLLEVNESIALPQDVIVVLGALDAPVMKYIGSAQKISALAFDDPARARQSLLEFESEFAGLEASMAAAGDKLQAFATAETTKARAFADGAQLLSLWALALSLAIAAAAMWVAHFHVLSPLAVLGVALQRLAKGDHATALPVSRNDEIGEIARTVEAFSRDSMERGRLGREARTLSELNEWLQSAKSEAELYDIIARFLARFLPECAGSIYIYANSRDVLDCAKSWNGAKGVLTMHPDDCWSLRRGRTFTFGEHEIDFSCAHTGDEVRGHYCCIPILAHGETVGMLHLEHIAGVDSREQGQSQFSEQRRCGLAAAEHISLAIANIKLREQLRDQSIRDVLTGLCNRRYFLEACRREFMRAERSGKPVAVLSVDVDHFKLFNDNHGHDAGDTVLRAVGEALSAVFRGEDVPCRFGGEEFVVLMPGSSAAIAAQRAEQLRARVEGLRVKYAEGDLPRITISIGVAMYPEAGANPMEVLKVADNALYAAKRLGRNRVELSESCREALVAEAVINPVAELRDAIVRGAPVIIEGEKATAVTASAAG